MIAFLFVLFSILRAADDSETTSINFSADVKLLMKLIINSLYSNKEIFLRELISNAVDAMNKIKIENETNSSTPGEADGRKFEVLVIPDEDLDELTVIDRGIGMDRDELVQNLGTIAHRFFFFCVFQIYNN
jgi:HSP90 family molecular chaperone